MKKEIDICDYCMKPIDDDKAVSIRVNDASIFYKKRNIDLVVPDDCYESLDFCNSIHLATYFTRVCRVNFPEAYDKPFPDYHEEL